MADASPLTDPRRSIPAVDRLLAEPVFQPILAREDRSRVVSALQQLQAELRGRIAAGETVSGVDDPAWYATRLEAAMHQLRAPSLVPVINATGVVLHTNLGRAPLADVALAAIRDTAAGYGNLEYDLESGERGSRYDHCVALLRQLTGAEDALVVNNNAAAVVLALNTLAQGRTAVVSRGELVEIGGGFRVPEIMARSGCRMLEVGSTNRTHLQDYVDALDAADAGALLKVHRSNFSMNGFVAEVATPELADLARQRGVPLLHDLGSGLLLQATSLGLPPAEPSASDALRQGADLLTLSGDKLLGGPQAGILLGRADLVRACRRNPLCRALRVDKLTIAALSATLALYVAPGEAIARIPVLRMLTLPADVLAQRALDIAGALRRAGVPAETGPGSSQVGGGAVPDVPLPTTLVRIVAGPRAASLERALRAGSPPVIGRVQADEVLLDPRTVPPESDDALADLVVRAWSA